MHISNTYRFFVPPTAIQSDTVLLEDPDLAHQLGKVLRLRPGDQVLFLDGLGNAYTVTLTSLDRAKVAGQVNERAPAGGELAVTLTLYAALLRAERFEWVLQKGTELGAAAFVPVQCARSLAGNRTDSSAGQVERKLARWQRIVREAAEQSCRGRLPTVVAPVPFTAACRQAAHADLALLLWEGQTQSLRGVLQNWRLEIGDSVVTDFHPQATGPNRSIAVLSGPEGGFTADELTTADEHGMIPVSLGSRILRAETAPIAAATIIGYELEG